ncbi:MAG: ABC transporter permease [Halobacteriales archaeon]
MTRPGRTVAAARAAWKGFVRRRTAVFFTFFFPAILIVIFGALVGSQAGGLFSEDPVYYVPGYLAVVVLFTPLSRVSSAVARHREGSRFEKLATTPLAPAEWLAAETLVNAALVGAASALVLALLAVLTDAAIGLSVALLPAIGLGIVLFCGVGALLGSIADSQDGAIAASNGIGLPLIFLSETFVPPTTLPEWFRPLVALSPLTYFARATRSALTGGGVGASMAILAVLAVVAFALGVNTLPWRD